MTEIDLPPIALQHLLPDTFTDGPGGWPTSPEIASHVLWHHMGREGQTPDLTTINLLREIDQDLKQPQDAMTRSLQRRFPVHYGYMWLARHTREGLSILEGVAKIGRTGEENDRG